jgi:hypothetical protein
LFIVLLERCEKVTEQTNLGSWLMNNLLTYLPLKLRSNKRHMKQQFKNRQIIPKWHLNPQGIHLDSQEIDG